MKLYKATTDILFVSEKSKENSSSELKDEAWEYMKEQRNWCGNKNLIDLEEITSKDQIPEGWREGQLVWGSAVNEITATDFLQQQENEFAEFLAAKEKYLSLKDKYEK